MIVIICIKCTYSWSYNPYCWLAECCNDDSIPADINSMMQIIVNAMCLINIFLELRKVLRERVYGQHLVNTVVDALVAHWSPHYKPQKALTLSFHGWPGSGKNYVSKFIADNLYKHGTKSKYVHHFIGRIHFPLEEHAHEYKVYKRCQNSLIYFNVLVSGKFIFVAERERHKMWEAAFHF